MASLLERVKTWPIAKWFFPGSGGVPSGGGVNNVYGDLFQVRLPGSNIDYRREAGPLWQNTVVLAAIQWIARTQNEAPLTVRSWTDDEDGEMIPGHPLSKLFRRPNPHYTGRDLRKAIVLSLLVDGNAYLFKVRSAAGKLVALYWVPHFLIEPRWPADGSEYLSWYEYRVNGKSYQIDPSDVVHLRDGIDPINTRKGLSRLSAALREVTTLNKAATYTAALMANSGVISLIIAPKNEEVEFNDIQAKKIKRDLRSNFRGEMTGDVLVLETPLEVHKPGYSPNELALAEILNRPELNVMAVIGIDAMVTGISGGQGHRTFSNYGESVEAAWSGCVLPLLGDIADQCDLWLLPELGDPQAEECGFDTAKVRALQPDRDKQWARATNAYDKGVVKRSEAKQEMGLDWDDEEDDVYKTDLAPTPVEGTVEDTEPGEPDADDPPEKKPAADKKPKDPKKQFALKWQERNATIQTQSAP